VSVAYRIAVDQDACMSSGKCVAEAPELFRFDADEIAEPVPGAPAPSDARILDLARACPAGALVVTDAETGDEVDVG
jgi:ferredoxin